MVEQAEEERRILEKIKVKMDKIKASQRKIQGPEYKEPENHYVGKCVVLFASKSYYFWVLKTIFH